MILVLLLGDSIVIKDFSEADILSMMLQALLCILRPFLGRYPDKNVLSLIHTAL